MGRILRIGNDTLTNYSFLQTSAYNSATTSPWLDSPAMDQQFTDPLPVTVTAQGCLVTFNRLPETFDGAMVKLQPTYDTTVGENPFFEMWVHDISTGWSLRASIQLSNPFVGIETGQRRILDLTFFPFLPTIDMVWLTMNPGTVGAPTLAFVAIQLFGQCKASIRDPKGGGGGITYTCDPTKQNLTTNPIVAYTGFQKLADGTFVPCPDTSPAFTPCDLPDLCNPTSIASYRECLRTIGDNGASLDNFNAWYFANQGLIETNCAGITNTDPPTMPLPPAPPLPALDLCDQTSIDAFRAAVSGNADALATFNAYIDSLTAAGYFELTCPPDDPTPVYVDPTTLQPGPDPNDTPRPLLPFGQGPGGEPPTGGSGGGPKLPTPQVPIEERTSRFILNWSGTDTPLTTALANGLVTPLAASTANNKRLTSSNNYGPAVSPSVVTGHSPAPYGFVIGLTNLPFQCFVGLKMWVFSLVGSPTLQFSISDAGIHTEPITGFCPLAPDWIITPSIGLTLAASPNIPGEHFYEYTFTGGGLVNQATLQVLLPRVDATQNDADTCVAGYKARNRHTSHLGPGPFFLPVEYPMAFQRGGCLVGIVAKQRARWVSDVSVLDYNNSTIGDYIHVPPLGIIFDITLRAAFLTAPLDLGTNSGITLRTVSDAQPTEFC